MIASLTMRLMSHAPAVDLALPPAPGADQYVALDFANSAIARGNGQFRDFLGTPAATNQWLADRELAPADAGLQEVCAARLRSLREQIRSLFAARVAGLPAPPAELAAVNAALTKVPTTALLLWDEKNGPYRASSFPADEVLDRALATLAGNAADLLTGPDAGYLVACQSSPCIRYLLGRGRRQWCSVRCGDRARAARAYARRPR